MIEKIVNSKKKKDSEGFMPLSVQCHLVSRQRDIFGKQRSRASSAAAVGT